MAMDTLQAMKMEITVKMTMRYGSTFMNGKKMEIE